MDGGSSVDRAPRGTLEVGGLNPPPHPSQYWGAMFRGGDFALQARW